MSLSRILVNVLPDLPYLLLLIRAAASVRALALPPLRFEALDKIPLRAVAHAHRFPHEALSVAFLERVHDFFAPCSCRPPKWFAVSARLAGGRSSCRAGSGQLGRKPRRRLAERTDVVFCVQMRVHFCRPDGELSNILLSQHASD